jgi:putative ABC transport system permease protein
MNFANLLKIAFKALNRNKLRAFLTMLGIIIGIAAVIAMLAIGQGSKDSISAQISEMGSNMIMIHPGNMERGGVRQGADDMQTLKIADYEALRDQASYLSAVSPMVSSSGQMVVGNNNWPSSIYGVTPEYMDIRKLSVEDGEMFTEADIKSAAKVCLLGQTVIENLFPNGENPIGRVVRFGKIPFTVIGVLASKGTNSMGMDQDDVVIAPYTTVMKRLLAVDYLGSIYASALSEEMTDKATDEITEILRTNHKLKESDDDDFDIRSQQELSEMLTSTSDMMTVLLTSIAFISLIVGGIGIMNMMYVSVTERTREIGLRMSIGARGLDIMLQFLIESIIISFTGGVIGVIVGCLATWAISTFAGWPVVIMGYAIILSFVVCTFTGILFGWIPAMKASRLDPIEAIRYE